MSRHVYVKALACFILLAGTVGTLAFHSTGRDQPTPPSADEFPPPSQDTIDYLASIDTARADEGVGPAMMSCLYRKKASAIKVAVECQQLGLAVTSRSILLAEDVAGLVEAVGQPDCGASPESR